MDDHQLDAVLTKVREGLAHLPGIAGLALGGSRARGTASADSDIDVGLYYRPDTRPDFDELYAAICKLDDKGEPDGFGRYDEWGPWINGGVWLHMSGVKMDILLRDLDKVERVINDCAAGRTDTVYQPGHPHGFSSAIYAGEVSQNIPFYDPQGVLAAIRKSVDPYPEALAQSLLQQFGWESGFALDTAVSAAHRGDIAYVTGCLFRSVACLNQVLHAAERRFLTNEKGALAIAAGFAAAPPGYADAVGAALGRISPDPEGLTAAVDAVRSIRDDVMARAQTH